MGRVCIKSPSIACTVQESCSSENLQATILSRGKLSSKKACSCVGLTWPIGIIMKSLRELTIILDSLSWKRQPIIMLDLASVLDGTSSLGVISSENLLLRLTRLLTVSIVMPVFQVMQKGSSYEIHHSHGQQSSEKTCSRVSIYVGRHRENLPLWQRKLEASTHRRLRG